MLYLKEALQFNNSIQKLNLRFNYMGLIEKNILYLKEALQINNSIQILNLRENQLELNDNYIINFKEALQNNRSIKHLDLRGNEFNEKQKNELYEALLKNNFSHKINFSLD